MPSPLPLNSTPVLAKNWPKTVAALAVTALIAGLAPAALADSTVNTTVNATDVIYAAGTQSGIAAGAGGTVPSGYDITGFGSLTFLTTGSITLNSGRNINDPDGTSSENSSSYNAGSGGIAGIVAPNDGFLVGVFLGMGGPSGSAPSALDFTTGSGTAFTSLSPELDQVFFIGDGLTGDGSGSTQTFYIPTGATELYLGISDACGYSGGPSCYGDNAGAYAVSIDELPPSGAPTVPEPESLMLVGTGILSMAAMLRRRAARA
jgi:hypothetical protein